MNKFENQKIFFSARSARNYSAFSPTTKLNSFMAVIIHRNLHRFYATQMTLQLIQLRW